MVKMGKMWDNKNVLINSSDTYRTYNDIEWDDFFVVIICHSCMMNKWHLREKHCFSYFIILEFDIPTFIYPQITTEITQ